MRFTAKNRASVSQSVQECPDPRPEGLVPSVLQLGLYDGGDLSSKVPGVRTFFFLSVFIFLLFLFHSPVVFENIGPG